MSPRKVRLVADQIKKYQIAKAVLYLTLLNKRAAQPIKKTLESAIANAVNNFKVNKQDLVIKEIQVLEGITNKRFHFAARGRVRPYKRRRSHITVVLEDKKEIMKVKNTPLLKAVNKKGEEAQRGTES